MMQPPIYQYGPMPVMPTLPPEKKFPVPAARLAPLIWAIVLIVLTVSSITLAVGGSFTVPRAPGSRGTVIYSNSLATDDGTWHLTKSPAGQCDYANGLGATGSDAGQLAPVCELTKPASANLRLSVRLVPQNQLAGMQRAVIRIHGNIVFIFDAQGIFEVLQGDPSDTHAITRVFSGFCDQCHTDGFESNTVVILVDQGIYTVAVNGGQIFQQQLDVPTALPTQGDIALGTYTPSTNSSGTTSEARFADLVLATF